MSSRDTAEAAVEELGRHLLSLPGGDGRQFLLACLRVLAEEARHAARHRYGGRPLEIPAAVLGAEWEWVWEDAP
jgi:hypothetical protein